MARFKQSVVQRDFSLMELREDFLDADGEEMRARSLRGGLNMRAMTTRVAQARPGSFYARNFSGAVSVTEIRPADGKIFGVVIRNQGLTIIDPSGDTVATFSRSAWGNGKSIWVAAARERTFIGHPEAGISVLRYENGSWSLNAWTFSQAEGGEIAQPYWAFNKDVSIKPSGRGGIITIDASKSVFTRAYVGQRIRYGFREIQITQYLSGKSLKGEVIGALPPSFELTITSAGDFRVGEVLIGEDTDWQGLMVQRLSPTKIRVVTLQFFGGPDVDEKITGPSGGAKVTAKTSVDPLPSTIWDEPLMSPIRGYPRSASAISGRLAFVDFPQVPDMIAISSARDIQDFKVGAADDDAIVRQEGDGSPRFLHAVNAGDLLLLSDRGCYYVPIRDNGVLTPSSFNAVLFDQRGCSSIRPVNVDDGVVFVEANGQTISAALLDGNVYLKWSIRALTLFHHHLINSPVGLCGPAINSPEAEKYLFIVNEDGSLAAMSWSMKLGDETVGFSPWRTNGSYRHVAPMFGAYWTFVDRKGVRMLERFSYEAYVDSALQGSGILLSDGLTVNGSPLRVNGQTLKVAQPGVPHLASQSVAVLDGPHYAGAVTAASDGVIPSFDIEPSDLQVGLPFTARAEIWPVELVDSPRIGMVTVRVIQISVSVQDTTAFQIVANGETRTEGLFSGGLPQLQTRVARAPIMGRRDHPQLAVVKHIPGPFRILAVGQEVQG